MFRDDHSICKVTENGGVRYDGGINKDLELTRLKDKIYQISAMTAEYMRLMETAPALQVESLEDRYKVLADFNGAVLAAQQTDRGVQFVTWEWDFDRKGVSHGHYFGNNYAGCKQDFAVRSGLVEKHRLFADEQLIEIYRCCADTLEAGFDLTYQQEKCIKDIKEQIECVVPDIMERIRAHDQQVLTEEPQSQGLTMK